MVHEDEIVADVISRIQAGRSALRQLSTTQEPLAHFPPWNLTGGSGSFQRGPKRRPRHVERCVLLRHTDLSSRPNFWSILRLKRLGGHPDFQQGE